MPLRVSNLQLPVEAPETELPKELGRVLGVDPGDLTAYRILRKSLDARQRFSLKFVYTVAVDLPTDAQRRLVDKRLPKVDIWKQAAFDDPVPGKQPLEHRPVVVGSGPAGILAGLRDGRLFDLDGSWCSAGAANSVRDVNLFVAICSDWGSETELILDGDSDLA